jgi:hypothetical protein
MYTIGVRCRKIAYAGNAGRGESDCRVRPCHAHGKALGNFTSAVVASEPWLWI